MDQNPMDQTATDQIRDYARRPLVTGIAGLVVGTVTGIMSMSKKREVDRECAGSACTPEGKAAADSGRTLGNVSTVAFGVGVVGLGAGVVLWFAAPRAPVTSLAVGVEGAW